MVPHAARAVERHPMIGDTRVRPEVSISGRAPPSEPRESAPSVSLGRMPRAYTACAVLLALPLLGSAANTVLGLVDPPSGDSAGERFLATMRENGLWGALAVGHLAVGVMLLVPRTRFAAGLVQLPLSIGIVAFNVMLFPPGIALAIAMLALNLVVVYDPPKLRALLADPARRSAATQ